MKMRIYESPKAEVVAFEAADVIATSVITPDDTPEILTTWGNRIGEVGSKNIFE